MQAEKWQELCEWAGFCNKKMDVCGEGGRTETKYYWFSPYEINNGDYISPNLPPQNMTSLFKWMIPKLSFYNLHSRDGAVIKLYDDLPAFTANLGDPFESLSHAIYKSLRWGRIK